MSDFEKALQIVLGLEGTYSDDTDDPGGKTRYGITEAVAREHGYKGVMQALPLDLAQSIYKVDYWDACRCEGMPWPLSLYVFDAAVNQGCDAARKTLQQSFGLAVDGVIGLATMTKAQGSSPWHWARFMAFRAIRYQGTRNFDKFGTGWITRLFQVWRG